MNIRRKKDAEESLQREIKGAYQELKKVRKLTEDQQNRLAYLEQKLRFITTREGDAGEHQAH